MATMSNRGSIGSGGLARDIPTLLQETLMASIMAMNMLTQNFYFTYRVQCNLGVMNRDY